MSVLESIKKAIFNGRLASSNEDAMQRAIYARLTSAGMQVTREHRNAAGRIDFKVEIGDARYGIECKTKGSSQQVHRQCLKYALTGEYDAIVVVTTKPFDIITNEFKNGDKIVPLIFWEAPNL